MYILDKTMIYYAVEPNSKQFHHTAQNSAQFKTCLLLEFSTHYFQTQFAEACSKMCSAVQTLEHLGKKVS